MKRFAVALLVVVWLFPVALHAAPYGTYDVRKVFVLGEKADARKSVTVNTEYLDRMIKDLTAHAGNYPTKFDSDADRQRARNDAGGLVYILNILANGGNADKGLKMRAVVAYSLAHNLDVPGAAQKADRLYSELVARYPDDAALHFSYGVYLGNTGRIGESLEHLEMALKGGLTAANYSLGMAYILKGDKERGLKYLRIYGAAYPEDRSIAPLIEAVEAGKGTVQTAPGPSMPSSPAAATPQRAPVPGWLPQSDDKRQRIKKIVTQYVQAAAVKDGYFEQSFVTAYADGLMASLDSNNGEGILIAHDGRRHNKFTVTQDENQMVRKVQVARYEKDFGETFAKNGIDRDRWPDLIRQFNASGSAVLKMPDGSFKYGYDFVKNNFVATRTRSYAPNINELPMYGGRPKTPEMIRSDGEFVKKSIEAAGSAEKAAEAVLKIGWGYIKGNDPRSAIKRFNQAWLLAPEDGRVYWGFGAAVGQQGRTEEAIRFFEKADRLLPGDANFFSDFGYAYLRKGSASANTPETASACYDRAISLFEKARGVDPNYGGIYANWAIVLYLKGDYRGAWGKVAQAERLGIQSIDKRFLTDLSRKMPRPVSIGL